MAYYARVNGSIETLEGYQYLAQAAAIANRTPGMQTIAVKLDATVARMLREMDQLAARSAVEADRRIVAVLDAGRVRGRKPSGFSGDLGSHIVSRPLPTTLPIGSFGIADIDELDRTVNPATPGYGTYWRSVEYGFNRGLASPKPIPGYFQPGVARPDPAQFRHHPYFEQMPYSRGMPALVPIRPQPAVRFLEKGTASVVPWHIAERTRIHNTAISALKAL